MIPLTFPYTKLFASLAWAVVFLAALIDPSFAATANNMAFHEALGLPPVQTAETIVSTPDVIFGLFTGVMLAASVYLFFIWIILRDRGQVFLMLFLLCLAVNMASTNTTIMYALGVLDPAMHNLLQSYSMILVYLFALFFTYYFLEVETYAPLMQIPFLLFGSCLVFLLVYASFDQRPVHFFLPTLGVLSVALILGAGMVSLRKGISGATSHIIAFCFFLSGTLALSLYDVGYITHLETAINASYLNFSIAAMMFAIVIAGQFAARQEEKERALAISNERFSLAARGSNEGLFDWNRRTDEIYISEQFYRITGLARTRAPARLIGWLHLVKQEDRGLFARALRKLKAAHGTASINFELRSIKEKTNTIWLHVKMIAVKDPASGRILRLVGSIGDITSRKKSEAELRASETRFRSITEAHPVPVLISRLEDHQILYASPGAEHLLGLPTGTLISNKLDRYLPHREEREEITDSIKEGYEINLKEVSLARGDGESLPAALSARRISYRGEAAMVVGLYDLTERKEAEQRIAHQQEALQQSEKMAALGGLLAGVAHELNNPLSVVMGQTTLLMETEKDEKIKARGEKIFKAADRCSRIVKSFLALARRKPPEHKNVDVTLILQSSLELLGYQFRNENVDVTINLIDDLPAVIGDVDQLTQVFINLAMNAAQAMHDWTGPRKITIQTEVAPENDFIVVSVIDTGPGVPPELQRKIFEPFFTTKGAGGTGVGLSLCLNIIASHGGQIILEDTPNGGTTFRVRLPIAKETAETVSSQEDLGKEVGKLSILIVDDEIELAETLADLLEPEGHEIDLAANGQIALDKLKKRRFDAIVSDLRMPVLDGPGLYAALCKDMPEYIGKIVYVTGDTLSPHVNAFLSENPVPVIEKPYRLADVQKALAQIMKGNAGQGLPNKSGGGDSPKT